MDEASTLEPLGEAKATEWGQNYAYYDWEKRSVEN
jgi:hypothetical protein